MGWLNFSTGSPNDITRALDMKLPADQESIRADTDTEFYIVFAPVEIHQTLLQKCAPYLLRTSTTIPLFANDVPVG